MIKRIRESEFYRHVLTILSGSTLAQLIPLLSEPIIVRLFTPIELGILALFLSVATIFASVATARYEMAIVLPKKDEMAINILALSLFISVLMSLFSGLIILFFHDNITSLANSSNLDQFLKWVPLYVLISGIFQSFNQWATRKKYFKNIAFSKLSQSSSNAGVSIGTGWLGWNTLGLIWGQMTGWLLGSFPLIFKFYQRDKKLVSRVNRAAMVEQAKKYKDFPQVNSAHVLSDIGQQSLVSFIIANYFTDKTLGFYSRMIRIVKVPAGFIGTAVGQVFYQKASEQWQEKQNIRPLLLKNIKIMGLIGIPIFSILALFGPHIFGFVLGKQWAIAGSYAQILTPWLLLNFMISPFTDIPLIVNKQKKFFLLSLGMNILVVLAFVLGYYVNGSILTAFIFISAFQLVFHIYLIFWFWQIAKK
jgi:O-antigen/teichoic acid export membrane protein